MALPLIYNWRNLFVRKLSTLLTFSVVAVVVFVLAWLLSFAAGMRASLVASGSSSNLLVLKPGATAESTSILRPDELERVIQTPGIAVNAGGQPMMSRELCVQTTLSHRGSPDKVAMVAVRGVDEMAFEIHSEIKLVEGRSFEPGRLEAVVGKATVTRYANLNIGDEISLGRSADRNYKVVGIFEGKGGALESEIWTPRTMLTDSYQRPFVSSVVLRLADASPQSVQQAIDFINGPSVKLEAKTETAYYSELAAKTTQIVVLTSILISIMAVGAVFAVANTMFAAVDGRKREVAMLRTIGFPRGAIITAFVMESLLISTSACVLGLAAGGLVFNGLQQDALSDTTWTVLAYDMRMTPGVIGAALGLAVFVGVAGSLAPALRASRVRIIEALRKA